MKRLLFALLAVALLPLSAAAQTTGVPKPKLSTANFGSTTSAELRAVLSDETGTGAFYTQGGDLGTPSAGVLTNATGLPVSTGIAGLGTGVAAALAINVGSAGAPVVIGGALGTPSSGTLTNATGLPIASGISGLGSGVATALAISAGSAGGIATVGGSIGAATGTSLALGDGLVGAPSFSFSGDLTSGMWRPTSGAVAIAVGGVNQLRLTSAVNRVPAATALGWGSTTADSASDTSISRIGAGIVGVGTGAAGNAGGELRAGVATFTGQLQAGSAAGTFSAASDGAYLATAIPLRWSSTSTPTGTTDLFLRRNAAANLALGNVDAASPVAQTLSLQNVVAGTSNTAGAAFTIAGSRGTGTGAGGSLIFQTAPAGSTGSSQNALATQLTLASTGESTFAGSGVTQFRVGNAGSSVNQFITVAGGASVNSTISTNAGGIDIKPAGTTALSIAGAGNVTIGTSAGTELLEVGKNQNATTQVSVRNTDTTNGNSRAFFRAYSGTVIQTMGAINTLGAFIGADSNDVVRFQQNGTTKAWLSTDGSWTVGTTEKSNTGAGPLWAGAANLTGVAVASGGSVTFSGTGILGTTGTDGEFLFRNAGNTNSFRLSAAGATATPNMRLGAGDAASPVAQTISVQSVVAGTSNTAGANSTIKGSASTGNTEGGIFIFQTTDPGVSGSGQNGYSNVVQIGGPNRLRITGRDSGTNRGIYIEDSGGNPNFAVLNNGSNLIGRPSLATNATAGFGYIACSAGTPTGVPVAQAGMAAFTADCTNNKWYFYTNGAWRDAGP